MNTQVDWNGKKTTIPHPSVPAFRLLCEQYGLFAKWDVKDKKLLLEKNDLKGKKVCLISKAPSPDHLEMKILRSVEHFLSETGMEVLVYANPSSSPKTGDVLLQCSVQQSKRIQTWDSTLFTTAKPYPKVLVESLQKDLRSMSIPSKIHRVASKRSSSPSVQVELNVPDMDNASQQEFIELISISLASGILRYFQEKHPMTLLASLSPEIRQAFLNMIPSLQQEDTVSEEMEAEPIKTEKVYEPEIIEKHEPTGVVSNLAAPELKAEVFFDYTLMISDDDDSLILGNLYIKNTGNQPLYNPTITLSLTPTNGLNLGGQILPPNAVDTLGVQSPGTTTWMFLEKDYLQKGRETGEYHIGATEPLIIQPGQMETHGLQISIIKYKVEGAVLIKGVVQFEQQGLQFLANNQIAISL